MKSFSIRKHPMIRLSGRFDPAQEGFPMLWSASSAEMNVRGSSLEVQIDCAYRTHKPYLSFEVDGLRAQTFAPLPGKHWYSVFLHLKPDTVHTVRILKESQAFENDPSAGCMLLKGRTDGGLEPLPPRRRKIEFIGDSLTSGEGGRGPQSFMEWVPMCFSASDNYTRFVADRLNAQYQLVSQSGWGVHCGWNNDPHCNLPRIYDQLCGPQAGQIPEENWGSGKLYDFSFQPDDVVIALGANDNGATKQPPFTDPVTGRESKLHDTPEDLAVFENEALDFLRHLHQRNPGARLTWFSYFRENPIVQATRRAVERAAAEGIPVQFGSVDGESLPASWQGSRNHPGVRAEQYMARALVRLLKK